jgi:hypothetical protein
MAINQRFIVWKLNNTNVDWKNAKLVRACVMLVVHALTLNKTLFIVAYA